MSVAGQKRPTEQLPKLADFIEWMASLPSITDDDRDTLKKFRKKGAAVWNEVVQGEWDATCLLDIILRARRESRKSVGELTKWSRDDDGWSDALQLARALKPFCERKVALYLPGRGLRALEQGINWIEETAALVEEVREFEIRLIPPLKYPPALVRARRQPLPELRMKLAVILGPPVSSQPRTKPIIWPPANGEVWVISLIGMRD